VIRESLASDLTRLAESLGRIAEGVTATHGALLRHQLAARSPSEAEYAPALFCLRLAEAISGKRDAGLAGAESLALLAEMGRVLQGLEDGRASSPAQAWGMPRALNAGDAFFGLAQECLASGTEGLPPRRRLLALASLDAGARAFSEALGAGARLEDAVRALFPAGAVLAAVLAGANEEQTRRLTAYAEALSRAPERPLQEVLSGATAAVQAA